MSRWSIAGLLLVVVLAVTRISCGIRAERVEKEPRKEIAADSHPLDADPYGAEIPALEASGSAAMSGREMSEYTRVLERLEAFVENGRREIRAMGELPQQAAVNPGLYATQIGIWEETRSDWSDDLVVIEGGLPDKPAREDNTSLHLGHLNLTRAISELRHIPFEVTGGRVPPLREREKRLDAAADYLRRARQSLENAGS